MMSAMLARERIAYSPAFSAPLLPRSLTPICNPGKDAIAAVLNPEVSNDLYFVATGAGGHVFSASIEEHEKNVANLRRFEHQQR